MLKCIIGVFLLSERITAIDDNTDYKMDLLKALHFLRRAWSNVKPETIANCFRKAGFVKSVETTVDTANDTDEMFDELMANLGEEVQETGCEVDEMKSLWADLQAMELVDGEFDDYLAVDDQLAIGGTLSLADIVAGVSRTEIEGSDSSR
uniref:DDE-1 domain-containing protein n=1 Tax=Ditylenchus dipsaci TaxID=166011 RepID=A0A915D8W6_9BILA